MNDHALAPVVAVMLILAIGVTVFAVYNSTYLPGLKEQAEVEHMKEVESGFAKFSSDIDNAIGTGNENVTFSEQVPLGGGDILVNSMQSSGTIQMRSENLGYFNITNRTTPGHYTNTTVPLEMVDFSYQPNGNFWINQSYKWQYGYVNVTKGDRETPLQYDTVTDPSFNSALSQFAGNLVRYYPKTNDINNNGTLQFVCINTSANNIVSSNGIARLRLSTKDVTDKYLNENGNLDNPIHSACLTFVQTGGTSKFFDEINNTAVSLILQPENNVTIRIVEMTLEVS